MELVRIVWDLLRGRGAQTAARYGAEHYIRTQLSEQIGHRIHTLRFVARQTKLSELPALHMGWAAFDPLMIGDESVELPCFMALPAHTTVLHPEWSRETPLLVYNDGNKTYYGLLFEAPDAPRQTTEPPQETGTDVLRPATYLGAVDATPLM